MVNMNKRLLLSSVVFYLIGLLSWTLLFKSNSLFNKVLFDVHLIYTSTIVAYFILHYFVADSILDFIKVFVRVVFRVWLLIFITFAISRSMERVGVFLSLTFIFGYFEALLDIKKWLDSEPNLFFINTKNIKSNKVNHALTSILFLSLIHILSAITVFVFYVLYGQYAMELL
jgi:hypothetical protein